MRNDGTLVGSTSCGSTQIASGVASISGESIDSDGRTTIDLVTTGGVASECHTGRGFTNLAAGVRSISKGMHGTIGAITTAGTAFGKTGGSWSYLTSNARTIA
jgi:hypothetical protein